ncbi:hypothetical protein DICVIV_11355 [Dictyocaulus viviparus]|uniref:Uncharacterized protein n=1 Tax=Dictyocaulus viviparus TaxID=29172 RepID=A0A0D8XDE2_DICVI|nr:hypothetical protein DICVIV_11355 [Dictyocaulus viviparus]
MGLRRLGKRTPLRTSIVSPLQMSGLLTNGSAMKDRKKAPPFHELELKLLMRLYCDSYEEYHGRGKEDKKNLLRHFAREVSNLGFYQRTEKQIEERLRADCKRRARIHEGQEAVLNSLPSYLQQLYECRKHKANGSNLLGFHDDDYDLLDDDMPSTCKVEVSTPREGTPVGEQPSSEAFMEMEDYEESAASTTKTTRRSPRKTAKASKATESTSPSMDRQELLYEEEIKLSMLRQQLALEELKLIVIKNDLARAQLERETIATERERFELERAKHDQLSEELKLYRIKQDLVRAQLEKETIALERERLKFEREKKEQLLITSFQQNSHVTSQTDS